MADRLVSTYARSIGVTEADAHTARNIHLSVADCKHLRKMLDTLRQAAVFGDVTVSEGAARWNQELAEYLKGAV